MKRPREDSFEEVKDVVELFLGEHIKRLAKLGHRACKVGIFPDMLLCDTEWRLLFDDTLTDDQRDELVAFLFSKPEALGNVEIERSNRSDNCLLVHWELDPEYEFRQRLKDMVGDVNVSLDDVFDVLLEYLK
jgi:hypothetical protein